MKKLVQQFLVEAWPKLKEGVPAFLVAVKAVLLGALNTPWVKRWLGYALTLSKALIGAAMLAICAILFFLLLLWIGVVIGIYFEKEWPWRGVWILLGVSVSTVCAVMLLGLGKFILFMKGVTLGVKNGHSVLSTAQKLTQNDGRALKEKALTLGKKEGKKALIGMILKQLPIPTDWLKLFESQKED